MVEVGEMAILRQIPEDGIIAPCALAHRIGSRPDRLALR